MSSGLIRSCLKFERDALLHGYGRKLSPSVAWSRPESAGYMYSSCDTDDDRVGALEMGVRVAEALPGTLLAFVHVKESNKTPLA